MNDSNTKAEVSAKEPWSRTLRKGSGMKHGSCMYTLQYYKDLVKVLQSFQAKLEPSLHKFQKQELSAGNEEQWKEVRSDKIGVCQIHQKEQHIEDMAVQQRGQTNQILMLSSVLIQQYYKAFW